MLTSIKAWWDRLESDPETKMVGEGPEGAVAHAALVKRIHAEQAAPQHWGDYSKVA